VLDRGLDERRRGEIPEQHLAFEQAADDAFRAFEQADLHIEVLFSEQPRSLGDEQRPGPLALPGVRHGYT